MPPFSNNVKTALQTLTAGGVLTGVLGGACSLGSFSQTAMRESPEKAASYCDHQKRLRSIDILTFQKDGIVVIDNVLTADELRLARENLAEMLVGDAFFGNTEQHGEDTRTDRVCWISETIPNQRSIIGTGMRDALRVVRSVPFALFGDDIRFWGDTTMGVPMSNQLASYSFGGHYVPHRDTPNRADSSFHHPLQWLLQPGLNDRRLTVILYLNDEDWDCGTDATSGESKHEGCLRCYLDTEDVDSDGSTATKVMNVVPRGGRMVIFDSKRILHEVRAFPEGPKGALGEAKGQGRQRSAITCWVGGQHSSYSFLRPLCVPRDEMNYLLWP